MKKLIFSLVFLTGIALTAFAGQPFPTDGFKKIDATTSSVKWIGKKVTGQHHGTINVKDGSLQFRKGILTGGNLTIDMTSIKVQDLQGETAGKLEGHLKSDDFFSASTFPIATLIILESKEKGNGTYEVKANLTIKGITQPITFPVVVKQVGSKYNATAELSIDRSMYEVKYGSGKFFENLGDKTIYDNFDLSVVIVTE